MSARARYEMSFVDPAFDWYSAWVPAIIYAISHYIGSSNNDTPLYFVNTAHVAEVKSDDPNKVSDRITFAACDLLVHDLKTALSSKQSWHIQFPPFRDFQKAIDILIWYKRYFLPEHMKLCCLIASQSDIGNIDVTAFHWRNEADTKTRHFAGDIFKYIYWLKTYDLPLRFFFFFFFLGGGAGVVLNIPINNINNIKALVHLMA